MFKGIAVLNAVQNDERVASRCVCCGTDEVEHSPAVLMPFLAHRVFNWVPVDIDSSWKLNTIGTGRAYTICNTIHCKNCGLVFLDIRFTPTELAKLYKDYRGAEYTMLREHYEPGYIKRNRVLTSIDQDPDYRSKVEGFLSPYVPDRPKILDWGGDTGRNTPFRGRATVFHVYDISGNLPIGEAERVERVDGCGVSYDLIVLSNVLEHVPFPDQTLLEVRKCMSEQTVLYVEVPFEKIMTNPFKGFFRAKKHWHEHINFFSLRSLELVARRSGYLVVDLNVVVVYSEKRHTSLIQILLRKKDATERLCQTRS